MHYKPVAFISGKITGDKNYKAKFEDAQKTLESRGFVVINPACLPLGLWDADYMRICHAMIDSADIVIFLPDWRNSRGARLEKQYCNYTGKPNLDFEDALIVSSIRTAIRKDLPE